MRRLSIRKTKEQLIKDYQEKLNLGYNFVDYFLTIGVDPEIFLNQWLYDSSLEELNSLINDQLKPKIINKFPSFDKKDIGISDAIIQHCFPLGFKVHEFNEEPENKLFSIILDNNNYSTIHQFKYVVCLIFYESINDYKKLYDRYYNINNNNKFSSNLQNNSFILEQNGLFNLNDNASTYSAKTNYNSNIANKFLNNFSLISFNSTKNPPLSDLSQRDTNRSSFLNCRNLKKYYIPKCICLISLYPYIFELSIIIKSIYKYSRLDKVEIPLEKIINNLILEVPIPPRGLYSVEYPIFSDTLLLTNSRLNDLFYANFDFDKLFVTLNTEQILKIFQCLLLGVKILFFSTQTEILTPIILTSLILLFPFKFPFPVVSILPKEAYYLIDNITPEILGINEKYVSSFFKDNDIDITDYLLLVDLDEQKLIPFKPPTKEQLPPLPKNLKDDLSKKLKEYNSYIHKNMKHNKKEPIKKFQYTIRNIFLNFQVQLLKDYPKYLNSNIYKHPTENPFKVKKFLKSVPKDDYYFYEKFIETQMFNDYIIKRMTPKDKTEQTEVLYFEEKILSLKEKNDEIIFLNTNLFDFNNQYKVPKVNSHMDENLLTIYNNEENHKKFLLDGINLIENNNENNNENNIKNKPLFNYILFPILNNELFFENEIKSYYLDLSIFNEIKNINSELISKSHLSRVEIQTPEMTNFVYILWLKIWANSFYYHDKIEQKYRYFQMLKVFNKISQHEMNVISNLFQGLFRGNADEDLIVNLYIKILQLKLSPSIDIFNSIKNMIRRKTKNSTMPSSEIAKYLSNKEQIQFSLSDMNKKDFRKRTMKSIYDMHITKEKVSFIMEEICNNCDRKINIYHFQKNINDTNNDIVWAKCPFCGFSYLPKLKVIFGDEINKNNKLSKSTSIVDEVILYSPKTLKMIFFDNSDIDIDNLKLNYNPIFWNLIWYFKINGLPFDFILPYEGEIFRGTIRKKSNFYKTKFSDKPDFPENNEKNSKYQVKSEKIPLKFEPKFKSSTNLLKNIPNLFNINNSLNILPPQKISIYKSKIYPNNILKTHVNKINTNYFGKKKNNLKIPVMQMNIGNNNNLRNNSSFHKKSPFQIRTSICKVRKLNTDNSPFINNNSPISHLKALSYTNNNNPINNTIFNNYINNNPMVNNLMINNNINNNIINNNNMINKAMTYNNILNTSLTNNQINTNINRNIFNIINYNNNIKINNMVNNAMINNTNNNNINNYRTVNNITNNTNINSAMINNSLIFRNFNNNNVNLINNRNNTPLKSYNLKNNTLINTTNNLTQTNYYQSSYSDIQNKYRGINYFINNNGNVLNNSFNLSMNKIFPIINMNKINTPRYTSYLQYYPYKI